MPEKTMREKFVIRITGDGVEVGGGKRRPLIFSASEALMLLDILREEEENLRRIADAASPMPVCIRF